MKHNKRIKPKKSDIIVPDIFEDEDDEDEEGLDVFEGSNLVVPKKIKRVLKNVQDDWVRSYIIN